MNASVEYCGDGSPRPAALGPAPQLELFPGERKRCSWCARPIRPGMRVDAVFGSQSCRQASHRFHRGAPSRVIDTAAPMRMGYADPPYLGCCGLYGHHHPDGRCWDELSTHASLFERLMLEHPDGWALSCSASSLPALLKMPACPVHARVAAWVRGERATDSYWPLNAWEPVIVWGGRPRLRAVDERVVDALVHVSRPRLTDPRRVVGAKPAAFIWWMFEQLGVLPGDELVDLFPGSGGVGRAWSYLSSLPPAV